MRRFGKAIRLGREMAELRDSCPEAWEAGEEMAQEALRTRSSDLSSMLRSGPESARTEYARTISEGAMLLFEEAVEAGEVSLPYPIDAVVLKTVGVACGTYLLDALGEEAKRPKEGSRMGACPECGRSVPLGGGRTVKNAHKMYNLVRSLQATAEPYDRGVQARTFAAEGARLADDLHNYGHRYST